MVVMFVPDCLVLFGPLLASALSLNGYGGFRSFLALRPPARAGVSTAAGPPKLMFLGNPIHPHPVALAQATKPFSLHSLWSAAILCLLAFSPASLTVDAKQ